MDCSVCSNFELPKGFGNPGFGLPQTVSQRAAETGKTFKQVVNETLRAGLERNGAAPAAT